MTSKKWQNSTRYIHVGSEPDPTTGSIMPAIHQTSTYVQRSPGQHQGYEYTRSHNPTRSRLEECLASAEFAKYCVSTSSGMAAATLVMHALPEKSTILCGDDVYGGTYRLFTTIFHERHNFIFIDTTHLSEVKKAIKKYRPTLLWLETPTNPLLKISDIQGLSECAHKEKAMVLVDNTFMSPYFQNPMKLGADVVLHSMTKYINGHSDVVGGALMLNKKSFYEKLWTLQNSMGPSPSPFDSWLTLRGIKTLALRMSRHEENAIEIAQRLEKNSMVERVIYPGLKSHPQHALAKRQMSGFGGMLTFFIKGGIQNSKRFLKSLEIFALAESLGGVESLVDHPAIMTHASIPPKIRKSLGISDNLIRLSVGVEDIQDLSKDIAQALKQANKN